MGDYGRKGPWIRFAEKHLLVCLSVLCVFALFSCGNGNGGLEESEERGDGLIVVGYAQVGAESAWRLANTASFISAFESDPRYDFRLVDSHNDPARQQAAVYDFIAQEVDYIIIAPVEEDGWYEILSEARDAGIPVIITDRMIAVSDESLYVCWVGAGFLMESLVAMDWLNDHLAATGRADSPINLFHMQGSMGSSAQIGRTSGINSGISGNSNLNLKEQQSGDFTLEKGKELMADWLQKYPVSEIDVLVAENDDMAFGAIRAMQEVGIKPGEDIIIISFDAGRNAVQAVADGLINCSVECNPLHGPRVKEVVDLLETGETPIKTQIVHDGKYFDIHNAAAEVENRF